MTATPQEIAESGESGGALYKEKFRAEYEQKHSGNYLAIDIESERLFLADTPEQALQAAQNKQRLVEIEVGGPFIPPKNFIAGVDTGFSVFLLLPIPMPSRSF